MKYKEDRTNYYKKSFLYTLFFFLLFNIFSISSSFAKFRYRVTPKLKSFFLYYPSDINGTENTHYSVRGELYGTYHLGKHWSFIWQPIIEYNPSVKEFDLDRENVESNSERIFYQFSKAYIRFRWSNFRLLIGNTTYPWGKHEGFSPLEVVNSSRYINPINTEKLASPSMSLKWNLSDSIDVETIYIPIKSKMVLPGENSRWLPRNIYVTRTLRDGTLLILPPDLQYHYQEAEELDKARHNNFAVRIRKKSANMDLSAIYFEGAANVPSVNLSIRAIGDIPGEGESPELRVQPDVGLIPVYYKVRTYGGSIVYTGLDTIFRLEGAFTDQISTATDKALPGSSTELAFSVEKEFFIMGKSFTGLLQGNWGDYESSPENGITSLSRIFERGLLLGFRYSHSKELSFIGSVFADLNYSGSIYTLYTNYKLYNNISATLIGSILNGEGTTPLGTYKDNDLISFNLQYDF